MSTEAGNSTPNSQARGGGITFTINYTAKAFPVKREGVGHTHQWIWILKPDIDEAEMSTEAGNSTPNSQARGPKITFTMSSTAKAFPVKQEGVGHTHQWTWNLKPDLDEDMSFSVKEVHFNLPDSYAEPKLIITKPPYEITETGCIDLKMEVLVFLKDPYECARIRLLMASHRECMPSRPVAVDSIVKELSFRGVVEIPCAELRNPLTTTQPLTQDP